VLAGVGLAFGATLEVSALMLQELAEQEGVAFTLPLLLFLSLVARGAAYDILMTARLREHTLGGKPVRGALADPVRPVATKAGAAELVLAIRFGTLLLESSERSRGMGLAMAFGILLASLVVSPGPSWRSLDGEPGGQPVASVSGAQSRRRRSPHPHRT
jgi:putative drug exporter of the RND superfamily